jgi:putative selenium metabolism hydrolase
MSVDQTLIEQIKDRAKGYEKEIVRFMRDVIAIPSVSCQEQAVVERIAEEMRQNGFDEVRIDAIGNVIGRVGNGPVKILYDSHIDTVGIGDPKAWAFDPFQGKLEDGIVYGRGASDNKAAIVTMVYGARIIKDLGLTGDVTLYVVGVVEEESCDGWAVKEMIEKEGVVPDYVVLGECTNLAIYRGHRGRIEFKVVTKGISCHASAPERGENAIYKMLPIIKGIENLPSQLKEDPFLGKGSIAVTMIECKTGSLNAIPDECTIYIDRRTTVGENLESCLNEIKALPGAEHAQIEMLCYEDQSWTGYSKCTEKYFPTWVLPEDHLLVQSGAATVEQLFGQKPRIDKWTFGTDASSLMGKLGIPTIGFGPSEEKWAHTVNDQVSVDHLIKATMFYALFPTVLAAKLST